MLQVSFMNTSRCRDPLHAAAERDDRWRQHHAGAAVKFGWKCQSDLWLKQVEEARRWYENLYDIF